MQAKEHKGHQPHIQESQLVLSIPDVCGPSCCPTPAVRGSVLVTRYMPLLCSKCSVCLLKSHKLLWFMGLSRDWAGEELGGKEFDPKVQSRWQEELDPGER